MKIKLVVLFFHLSILVYGFDDSLVYKKVNWGVNAHLNFIFLPLFLFIFNCSFSQNYLIGFNIGKKFDAHYSGNLISEYLKNPYLTKGGSFYKNVFIGYEFKNKSFFNFQFSNMDIVCNSMRIKKEKTSNGYHLPNILNFGFNYFHSTFNHKKFNLYTNFGLGIRYKKIIGEHSMQGGALIMEVETNGMMYYHTNFHIDLGLLISYELFKNIHVFLQSEYQQGIRKWVELNTNYNIYDKETGFATFYNRGSFFHYSFGLKLNFTNKVFESFRAK